MLLLSAPVTVVLAAETSDAPVTKTLVWPDGTRYVGGVIEGKRTGKGTIFWQDGTRFVGKFENDMRNGPGTMILPDGTVYTGFFKNDELIDTESTIAASNTEPATMDDAETTAALGDTKLPMEADSLAPGSKSPGSTPAEDTPNLAEPGLDKPPLAKPSLNKPSLNKPPEIAQVDEKDLITPAAPSSDNAVASMNTDIDQAQTAAEDVTETLTVSTPEPALIKENPFDADVTEVTESVKTELMETIDLWVSAWEDQNLVQYLENYSSDFVVPGRQSKRTWEALRRTRLARPEYINVDVLYQRFEFVEANVVDVFFRQTYRSDSYSDLTDKVTRMKRENNSWKILVERSR